MDDEQLIECVRAQEILYNKGLMGYRLPERKEAAWAQVASCLGTTEDQCSKRWQSLRERYSRELRKQDAPSGSGAPANDTWPLYRNMAFLKEFIKSRPMRSTTNILAKKAKTASTPPTTSPPPCWESNLKMASTASTPPSTSSPPWLELYDLTQEMDCSQQSPVPPPSPAPSTSKKRKIDNDGDEEFRELVQMYKDMFKDRLGNPINETIRGFSQMITSIIAEMSEQKQMKTIQTVTNMVLAIKNEPEE